MIIFSDSNENGVLSCRTPPPRLGIISLSVLIVLAHFLIAAEPEENTIPVIGMRASNNEFFSGIGLRLLCELSWKHFDGVEVEGPVVNGSAGNPELAESTVTSSNSAVMRVCFWCWLLGR